MKKEDLTQKTFSEIKSKIDKFLKSEEFLNLVNYIKNIYKTENKNRELLSDLNELILTISVEILNTGKFDKTLQFIDELFPIIKKANFEETAFKLLYNKAITYKERGDYSKALNILNSNIDNMKKSNRFTARFYIALGSIYYQISNYSQALEYFLRGYHHWLKENVPEKTSQCLNNIAIIYKEQKLYDKAIYYFTKAIEIKRKQNNINSLALSLVNIGTCYSENKIPDKAEEYYSKALKLVKETNFHKVKSIIYNNIGNFKLNKNDRQAAEEYFRKAIKIKKKIKDKWGFVNSSLNLIETLMSLNKKNEIEKILNEIEPLLNTIHSNLLYNRFYKFKRVLSENYKNYKEALYFNKIEQKYKNKLQKDTFNNKIAQLDIEYDFTQKEKERKILQNKNEELAKKNIIINKKNKDLEKAYNEIKRKELSYHYVNERLKYSKGNEIIGSSEAVSNIRKLIKQLAKTPKTSVLILGESGTGKELVARAIHYNSNRRSYNFVTVNTPAIPHSLFESQLFGHKKNSFTGANNNHIGLLELANNGTVFLDEICSMPMEQQAKILRALEESKITPIGGNKEISLNLRILSASNNDLQKLIKKSEFRADLYHRIARFVVNIPPLRERKEDIPELIDYFTAILGTELNKKITKFENKALRKICDYNFPGNIRELKNIIERALIATTNSIITEKEIQISENENSHDSENLKLADNEKRLIKKALALSAKNQKKAASYLGISPKALERRMRKYGIKTARQ